MSDRFDLDIALAAWRRSLQYNRALTGEDLDELAQHVRDQVAGLTAEGWDEEAAFREAMREMGDHGGAEREYGKVYWGKRRRQGAVLRELQWRLSMLTNYLKIAVRNLLRQKGYAFINVAGLALGLACCLLILQYVAFEYGFDRFNQNTPDLYRVLQTHVRNGGAPTTYAVSEYALGPALAQEVPEVVRFARLYPEYNGAVVTNPARPDDVFEEARVYYADPVFLEMFSYPLIEGTPGTALAEPGTVLLSASAARKYFGDEDPVGQVLDVAGWISGSFRVSGLFEDVSANSHLQFDLLLPMVDLLQRSSYSDPSTGWGWLTFITYVQLRPGADLPEVERKFTDILVGDRADYYRAANASVTAAVQPLADIHLNEAFLAPKAVMGSRRAVYFFSVIGLVTLLIALVNYVNLATARALGRAREVGVRKVVGAHRGQLITQFLSESALTLALAVGLAVGLALALRQVMNEMAGTSLTTALWARPVFWAALLAVLGAATLLGGLYPAFVLSSFRPAAVLKGGGGRSAGRGRLRRGLVVFQFAASIVLLVGTAVVYRQLAFMRTMDLGIDLEQILMVAGPRVVPESMDRAEAMETFTRELSRLPAVRQAATSGTVPGQGFSGGAANLRRATADPSTEVDGVFTYIDSSFAGLYGLDLIAGEGFANYAPVASEGVPAPVIVNEQAVRALDFATPEDALGQDIHLAGNTGRVVGVFRDFNWSSAHRARENAVFFLGRGNPQISLKIGTDHLPEALAAVERIYTQHFPGDPFRYAFVDEQFDAQYRDDRRFATLFGGFAGLAIAIACLGLFGLAAFTARQRTKEIGVRKVLGASVPTLVALLSKDFLLLVGLAFVVAAPVAYVLMQRWLEGFAYRIELSGWTFLLAGLSVLSIALLTVSYQAVKAALADPVESLRYE